MSDAVKNRLPSAVRAAGPDRYATAVAVVKRAAARWGFKPGSVFIARGDLMADALGASAFGRATLLSAPGSLPGVVTRYLRAIDPSITLLGGTAALSNQVREQACAVRHQLAAIDATTDDHVVFHCGIGDHGDPSRFGSIAWFLDKSLPGQRVTLHSSANYVVNDTLVVPGQVTLSGLGDDEQVVLGGNGLDSADPARVKSLVALSGNKARVIDLVLDGNRNVKHVISGKSGLSDNAILRNIVRNTKNDWPSGSNPRCHGISLFESTRLVIAGNEVHHIGYPKQNDWSGVCAGLNLDSATDITVKDNRIQGVLTAGIDFTKTIGATIDKNVIIDSGLNAEYGDPTADGITAYHNLSGGVSQDWVVTRNRIDHARHYGIHLSGPGVLVKDNVVRYSWLEGILHQDHKSPTDCAFDVDILNNQVTLDNGRAHVYIGNNYRQGTIAVHNSGSRVTWEQSYCN